MKNDAVIAVLFIATDDGRLRKMAKLGSEMCLIEEIKIVPNGARKPVKALKLSSKKVIKYCYLNLFKAFKILLVPFIEFSTK